MTISHKTFPNVVCNDISELFSSVMQSHGLVEAKSRDFLMHIKTLNKWVYSVVYAQVFSSDKKSSGSVERIHFFMYFFIYLCTSWHFHPAFLMQYPNLFYSISQNNNSSSIENNIIEPVLGDPLPCTCCMSPKSDTPNLVLAVSTNEMMWNQVC